MRSGPPATMVVKGSKCCPSHESKMIGQIVNPQSNLGLWQYQAPSQRWVEVYKPEDVTGVLVLEELEHAKARNAPILAEYIGGSFTCDAHHMTEPLPDGTGVGRCIAMCGSPRLGPADSLCVGS